MIRCHRHNVCAARACGGHLDEVCDARLPVVIGRLPDQIGKFSRPVWDRRGRSATPVSARRFGESRPRFNPESGLDLQEIGRLG